MVRKGAYKEFDMTDEIKNFEAEKTLLEPTEWEREQTDYIALDWNNKGVIMKDYDATETAYKNGYEKAKQDILNIIYERRDSHMKNDKEETNIGAKLSNSAKIIELFDLIQIIEGMK